MTAADAIGAGFADVEMSSGDWPSLRAALCRTNASDVRSMMSRFAVEPSISTIAAHRAQIDRAFTFETVEGIVAALENESSDFAAATLKALGEKSPTSLKVTLALLRCARGSKSLKDCLVREYTAAQEVFVSHDFVEGVRAVIIDKDRNPKWMPARLEDVTPEIVARYFAPHAQALTFPN
jgi:enoyl-CoA hydratase